MDADHCVRVLLLDVGPEGLAREASLLEDDPGGPLSLEAWPHQAEHVGLPGADVADDRSSHLSTGERVQLKKPHRIAPAGLMHSGVLGEEVLVLRWRAVQPLGVTSALGYDPGQVDRPPWPLGVAAQELDTVTEQDRVAHDPAESLGCAHGVSRLVHGLLG